MRAPLSSALLCASITLACGGSQAADAGLDSGPSRYGEADAPDVVAGRVLYEDRPYTPQGFTGELVVTPSAGVRVEISDASEAVLARVRTDASGEFRVTLGEVAPDAALFVRAYADVEHEGHYAEVWTRTEPTKRYSIAAPVRLGQTVELLARWRDGSGGPFNVVDTARRAFVVYAPHVGVPAPTLRFDWERGRPYPCGSCFSGGARNVISLGGQLEDTDEYDDDIILHELGHYWVEHYGRDTSPAGFHRDRRVAPELAYGEGLAYFFACLIRGTPIVVDNYATSTRVIDLERHLQNGQSRPGFVGVGPDGALREEIPGGLLWDAFDPPSADEPADTLELGLEAMFALLTGMRTAPLPDVGSRGVETADLLRALECRAGASTEAVQALADERSFPYEAGGC